MRWTSWSSQGIQDRLIAADMYVKVACPRAIDCLSFPDLSPGNASRNGYLHISSLARVNGVDLVLVAS
jgi:hypothetical protein